MGQDIFNSSDWYRAATLNERAAALPQAKEGGPGIGYDEPRGLRRLRRWREKANFKEDRFFIERLEAEGLDEEQLRRLLGEDGEAVKSRTAEIPVWLANWASAFSDADRIESTIAPMAKELWRDHPSLAFLTAIAPLIRQGRERLRAGVEALLAANPDSQTEIPFDPANIENLLFRSLPVELAGMMSRTMALELNVARLSEELTGETADERFESYIESLANVSVAQRVFAEYPVLARSLTETIDRRINAGLELLERLCRDWPEIRSRLCGADDPGKLKELSFGMGDTHRGGRTVAVMSFSSANSCDSGASDKSSVFKLVYKPRSLAVEGHFQELLAWLNERGEHPSFRLTNVIDRDEYGWVEFIAAADCDSPDEVKRFYRRQGAYLALLYGLEATDFHGENLIAAGEHPILIDLESLFHAREKIKPRSESKAGSAAQNAIGDSVIRIGLLPVRIWGDDENDGVDLSGLGRTEGQLSPNPAPYWENGGTDEMRLERKRIPIHASLNRPVYEGRPLNALDYTEDILTGFTEMYRLLLHHCDALISGPLAAFGEDETRCILRPTMIYGWMLNESLHPDLQRDALDRDRFFDRMWLAVESRPELRRAVPFELRDLREGDVPLFTSRPASRDLFASCGLSVEGFFERTGLELVERKLRALSVEDLERQCWFIRASLSALAEDVKPAGHLPPLDPSALTAFEPISKAQLIAAARKIGDRLEQMAYRGEDDAMWLGLTFIPKKHWEKNWTLTPIGADLYDGLPGIALFLGRLGQITGEHRYGNLARAVVVSIRRQIEDGKRSFKSLGGFSGLGGVIYAFTHLAGLLNQTELLDEAESMLEIVPELLKRDRLFDIVGGAAGCLTALLGLNRLRPSERTLKVTIECGEHLLANAKPMGRGAAWQIDDFADVPLTGFSHGATGIAYALLELFAATGDGRFRQTALEALEYERSLFSVESANWPDLRKLKNADGSDKESSEKPRFVWAWCHGAAGAALGRIKILPIYNDEALSAEAEAATRSTLHYGMGGNHSLCHGSLGNLETLQMASEMFADSQLAQTVNLLASAIVESFEAHGWVCGNPINVESPGLMTGLAGIGYQLLRLAEPRSVPSVLSLEAPIETTAYESRNVVPLSGGSVDMRNPPSSANAFA